jgi:uncharacterized membrane protein (UPF0127 family)
MQVWNATRGTELGGQVRPADSIWLRFIGLMGRRGLAEGEGLHIVPCSSVHMFFMRFALDLVYLDRSGSAVKLVHALKPWRLSAARGAQSVLELPAGAIDRSGTAAGDRIELR